MEHISEIKLLDYIAGRLDVSERENIGQHIAQCSACASRCREFAGTWDMLDQWQIDSSDHLVSRNIETLVAESKTTPKFIIFMRSSKIAALRVAAAIILAIVGGHVLGRYGGAAKISQPALPGEGPRYVAALGFEWSSGLSWAVLEQDQSGVSQ